MLPQMRALLVGIAVCAAFASNALAEESKNLSERINRGVVGIASGGVNGTYIQVASDLATVLDNGDKLRVIPMVGKGSVQNITDLLYLKGVDMGIVQSDVLTFLQQERVYRGLNRRVAYITKLYNEEFHLLARDETKSIEDLAGKKVNFGVEGSGTSMTAKTVFSTLGVEVEPTSFDEASAVEKLKAGEIDGVVYVAGKPARLFGALKAGDGLHFLPVPFASTLAEVYLPARLTNEDYPDLVAAGGDVDTLAVGAVLAAFNWSPDSPRYKNMARFIDAFFTRFDEFKAPGRHKKWTEISLTARVPGWRRFKAAEDWLHEHGLQTEDDLKTAFLEFLAEIGPASGGTDLSEKQKELLFGEFIRWRRQQAAQSQ